ncbi:MAG: acyl-CoA/acyl-ACP dehydrogenase [Pirellulales bacterium]|nr:acyl-CoA/acyl-ACP dehydrogenase [Pirellulales bacterium]
MMGQASIDDHLTDYLPATHPLSPRQAFQCFPPLTASFLAYQPSWIWDQDTASLPVPLAELRRQTRSFAERVLAPRALEADRHPHDPAMEAAVLKEAAEAGMLYNHLPQPIGSGAMSLVDYPLQWAATVKVEELCAACGGWGLFLSAHALGLMPLLVAGDKKILKRFVIPANRRTQEGEPYLFAFAITEPGAGSDVEEGYGASICKPNTVARRAEGGWILNGRKLFISGGDIANAVTAFAALDGEDLQSWTCFLVENQMPGFHRIRNELKMGQRASGATELEFRDVFVPDDHVIGGLRNGWALNRASLNCSRQPVAAIALGIARMAMDAAIDFACRFRMGGRPLLDYQEIQIRVADMIGQTSAMRSMIWQHASRQVVTQANASMCKVHCSDAAVGVCQMAMELLGNHGVLHQNHVEKQFRDARLTQIYEGTNQINRLAIIEDFQETFLSWQNGYPGRRERT